MLQPGSPVRFTSSSKYAGKHGTVVSLTPKQYYVSSPEIPGSMEKPTRVPAASVELLDDIVATLESLSLTNASVINASANPSAMPEPRRRPPSKATPPRAPASYSISGSEDAPVIEGAGGMVIERVTLRPKLAASKASNFLMQRFGERIKLFQYKLPVEPGTKLLGRSLSAMGRTWELLCAEVEKDENGGGRWGAGEVYSMHYVAVAGEGLQTIDLRKELEDIAAFEAQVRSPLPATLTPATRPMFACARAARSRLTLSPYEYCRTRPFGRRLPGSSCFARPERSST